MTSCRPALALLAAALLAAMLLVAPAHGQKKPTAPHGYDHPRHQGKVAAAGKEAIACSQCHPVDRRGKLTRRPGHAECFGACHGAPPRARRPGRKLAISGDQERVCASCHSPAALDSARAGGRVPLTVSYPPYRIDVDYGIALSHAVHAEVTRNGRDCATCHDTAGRKTASGDPHRRCAGCHLAPDGKPKPDMPAMTECAGCHVSAMGPLFMRPYSARGAYPVTATFSHQSHRARGARDCRTCHQAAAGAKGLELPAPSMKTCQSCHDGKRAFSTVAPSCRRCHQQNHAPGGPRQRPGKRFDHRVHSRLMPGVPCTRCHRLDRRGAPLPPGRDHAPCSDAGCHRDQFSAAEPTICGPCHIGTEPWRHLHFDRPPRAETEFGARFSHLAHLEACRQGAGDQACAGQCQSCHREAAGSRDMRLPRHHTPCMAPGCHGQKSGARPNLDQCDGCHALDLVTRRRAKRLGKRWSVRARFRHRPHRKSPKDAKPLQCAACHTGLQRARTMDDIPTPAKAACIPCHDGKLAFKVTGHGCARCHAPAR